MKLKNYSLLLFFALLVACCSGSEYPMDKKYWTPSDYQDVLRHARFGKPKGDRLPELSNNETSAVFKKLVDHQNFLVILTNEELGLSYRNELSDDFFEQYKVLYRTYWLTDEKDNFTYGDELLEVMTFGLSLQLHYFKLGNAMIIKDADDPDNQSIKRLTSSNLKTVFQNYTNYLDLVNSENGLSETNIITFAQGIEKWFPKLFETFPNGNLDIIKSKTELMLKKSTNEPIKESLQGLLQTIDELESKS